MSKIKIIIISVLVILSCTSFVFASSVNMNLANENATALNSDIVSQENNINNNSVTNNISNNNANSTTNNPGLTNSSNYLADSSNISANIESVKSVNDIGDSSMDIGQILNIFLIAVGVILIFLAIAILIRMKK